MGTVKTALQYATFFVFGVAVIELLIALFIGKKRDPKEALANFGIWAVGRFLRTVVMEGLLLGILVTASRFAFFSMPIRWWSIALTLLVADFIYYWHHRLSHQIRFLWAFHSIHHSSKEFNLSTAVRLPWLGTVISSLFYIPAVLVGFPPVILFFSKAVVLLYQYWIHTEAIGHLGAFDRVFNSPSNHRVHHGSDAKYLDKNHGGILISWDRLFGTYQEEEERPVYGLTKPLTTYNPFVINFHEPVAMVRDVKNAASWREAWGYIFGAPGWRPAEASLALAAGA